MAKSGLYLLNVTLPVSVPCLIGYAQERSSIWREVSNSSGQEVGTAYIYLIDLPRQEDRLQAMQDCADQNTRKNNRERCKAALSGHVGVQFQKSFLTDSAVA